MVLCRCLEESRCRVIVYDIFTMNKRGTRKQRAVGGGVGGGGAVAHPEEVGGSDLAAWQPGGGGLGYHDPSMCGPARESLQCPSWCVQEFDYPRLINKALPPEVRILGWTPVPADFNARCGGRAGEWVYVCVCQLCVYRMRMLVVCARVRRLHVGGSHGSQWAPPSQPPHWHQRACCCAPHMPHPSQVQLPVPAV